MDKNKIGIAHRLAEKYMKFRFLTKKIIESALKENEITINEVNKERILLKFVEFKLKNGENVNFNEFLVFLIDKKEEKHNKYENSSPGIEETPGIQVINLRI